MSLTSWAIALAAPLPFWLAYATAQALLLRRAGAAVGRWLLPFAVGVPVGVVAYQGLFYLLSYIAGLDVLQSARDAAIVLTGCFLNLVAIAALAQWAALRQHIARPWRWAPGLGLLAMVIFLASAGAALRVAGGAQLVVLLLTGLAGAALGALSGLALRMARPAPRPDP